VPRRAFTMAERVSKEKVERKAGYLYYIGRDGYVWQVPMRLTKGGRKQKVGNEKVTREEGYLYFLDKAGYVARVRRRNA
jgi:hypothetical protein